LRRSANKSARRFGAWSLVSSHWYMGRCYFVI
jgi:hypothetical protein